MVCNSRFLFQFAKLILTFILLGIGSTLQAQDIEGGASRANDIKGGGEGVRIKRPQNPPVKLKKSFTGRQRSNTQSVDQIELAIDRGNKAINADRHTEAEKYYRQAITLNSKEWRAHYGLANAYLLQERFDDAEDAYQRAVELNPRGLSWMTRNSTLCVATEPNSEVFVESIEGSERLMGTVPPGGYQFIFNLKPGSYRVSAELSGKLIAEKEVEVRLGQIVPVTLNKMSITQSDKVIQKSRDGFQTVVMAPPKSVIVIRMVSTKGAISVASEPNAHIVLKFAGGDAISECTVPLNERICIFRKLKPGRYNVKADLEGYQSGEYELGVSANSVSSADIRLKRN